MSSRYLKITETRQGRTIECWVYEKELLLEDNSSKECTNDEATTSPWVVASMFIWGFLGIYIGNVLFISV